MKKLFLMMFTCFALLLVATTTSKAQNVRLVNNTSCSLSVIIHYGTGQPCTGYTAYTLAPGDDIMGGVGTCYGRAYNVGDNLNSYTIFPNQMPTTRSLCSSTFTISGDANNLIIDP